jgi:hypothetical protein
MNNNNQKPQLNIPIVGRSLFCKQYHNREKSIGCLMTTRISILPERDGNRMDMLNELIREGWELVYIKNCQNELTAEWLEFTLHRWVEG